jgi:hypothetical protein
MRHIPTLLFLLLIALVGCRKNDNQGMLINGKVSDVRNNSGLGGVDITLSEQVVEDGSLNASFQLADETTTDGGGNYELDFERRNALVYRVDYEKQGYFSRQLELNPDDLTPGEPFGRSLGMIPEATFEVRILNANPVSANDEIRFRNLDGNFGCACCNTDWIVKEGMMVDTTFSCRLHGDFMMHFTYEITKVGIDSTVVDSVYCPAFQTTAVTIEY